MKKLLLIFAAALLTVSANAQIVTESKTSDNWYIGVNGGVATASKGHAWLKDLQPNAGLRLGRWFTPVFGLAVESNAYFKNTNGYTTGTLVNALNTSLLATVNMSNWFGGYKGEPRCFEVIPVLGLGWGHIFGSPTEEYRQDLLTSKVGIDFAFNETTNWYDGVAYNLNKSAFQLNVGLVYKFKNSNGTHNFTIAQLRDQAEIDALNAQINDLRNELAKKPKEVVKEIVKETPAPAPQEVKVENLVFVTFAQGKSLLTKEAKAALDGIAEGKHVQIVGTASPEGSKEINDKLSQARADVVGDYLKGRGIIVDEATGKGVQGTTSNRLAVVYVK